METSMTSHSVDENQSRGGPHVAFFLPDLGGGGTEKIVVTLANGLFERGYRVDVVLVRAEGVYRRLLKETIEVVDLKAMNSYFSLPALVAYLRSRRPRVLISSLDLTNLVALIAHWISGSRALVAIRIENIVSAQRRTPWKKGLEKRLLSWLYPRADRIIAVSGAVATDAAHYIGIAPSRIDIIYNPVITEEHSAEAIQAPVHPWFAEGCPPVILGVGRLTAQKDFVTLVQAFALVRRQRLVRLIILGEGEERDRLLALARELNVEEDIGMPGFVQHSYSFMKRCKVFVLSSIYEGLPTVLIEALASGCSVVSTDCPGGSREILSDGAYGELVPVGDALAMADAICGALDGNPKPVNPAWLDQFRIDHVIDQNLKILGLPAHPQ